MHFYKIFNLQSLILNFSNQVNHKKLQDDYEHLLLTSGEFQSMKGCLSRNNKSTLGQGSSKLYRGVELLSITTYSVVTSYLSFSGCSSKTFAAVRCLISLEILLQFFGVLLCVGVKKSLGIYFQCFLRFSKCFGVAYMPFNFILFQENMCFIFFISNAI